MTSSNKDFARDFFPVICNNSKKNGHVCNTLLGHIEITRPNACYHYCKVCKINYRHEADENGNVTGSTPKYRPRSIAVPTKVMFKEAA